MIAAQPANVAVLIPALNEAAAIRAVVESALAHCPNLILVDDGSSDATVERVADLPLTLIRHDQPRGKGEALRAGFRKALELGYDGVLTMDGDGQHVAADIPRLLAAARRYPEHLVIGARLVNRHRQPGYRRAANNFGDLGISLACGQRVLDTQSGQRYYPRAALALADVAGEGFVFESQILIEASRRLDMRVVAVPIESRYHSDFRASHFRALPDFLRISGHVLGQIFRGGRLWSNVRRMRREAALVFAPDSDPASAGATHQHTPVLDKDAGNGSKAM